MAVLAVAVANPPFIVSLLNRYGASLVAAPIF